MNNDVVRRRRIQTLDLAGERLAGAGHAVSGEEAGIEQLFDDDLKPTLRIYIDHRIQTERSRRYENRYAM